jgi:CRISPR-associated endonuclease Cas1
MGLPFEFERETIHVVGTQSRIEFFRLRILLEVTEKVCLHAHHAGVVYALICAANERSGGAAAVPDGIMPDVVEQCRIVLLPGQQYAFGMTFLAPGTEQATAVVRQLTGGLTDLGAKGSARKGKLDGNFRVARVEDLVAGHELTEAQTLSAVPSAHIRCQIERIGAMETVTLRFVSPLRLKRPSAERRAGHFYMDGMCFDPSTFLARLIQRLAALGFGNREDTCSEPPEARTLANGLVWLDLAYGPRSMRKTLGGAVGRVTLRVPDPRAARLLVLGQYVRIGENTRFGFGSYTVDELGPDLYACKRAVSLLSYCLKSPEVDVRAAELDLPSGVTREAVGLMEAGHYQPEPHTTITIRQGHDRLRRLSIPSRLDRALQRAVMDRLGPALNMLFEESSFAYRKGLGRNKAANRIRGAYRQGFRYALRTDFSRFFDSIDHDRLRCRLEAYLADDEMVDLLMSWVENGAPEPGRGLPTGAPLSPLISNLFLDTFDEQVEASGACLVRYADDFLMLFKSEREANQAKKTTQDVARQLLLTLNEDKTLQLNLAEPFDFLGYRFERHEQWEILEDDAPRRVEDLGWHDAKAPMHLAESAVSLPGELDHIPTTPDSVVILGPGAALVKTTDDRLVCSYVDGRDETSTELAGVGAVIVLGRATIAGTALHQLLQEDIPVFLAGDSGAPVGLLNGASDLEDPETMAAQVFVARDEARRLAVAQALIGAKVRNYASLAASLQDGEAGTRLNHALLDLAEKIQWTDSVDETLGIEGAAAARWYEGLDAFLPDGFRFDRRVAPHAKDPINVMLNIAYTVLYRQLVITARQCGLVPSLGIMHKVHPGHAALASDLQEPFRHLMDLAVLLAAREMSPDDFHRSSSGPFALQIRPQRARQLYATIWSVLARHCQSRSGGEIRSYRMWMATLARSLRRHLKNPSEAFEVFEHP